MSLIKEYFRDHGCKGTNMAYKCKIFVAVTKHFAGINPFRDCYKLHIHTDTLFG